MATIDGTAGNDILTGTANADTIHGLDGSDTINGGGGNDILYGDDGADTLNGEAGDDTLYGGEGADSLSTSNGNDFLYGEAGVDFFSLTSTGTTFADGGSENDTFELYSGHINAFGGTGNDTFRMVFCGGTLTGGSGQDKFVLTTVYGPGNGDPIVITDFEAGGAGDAVDLAGFFAKTSWNGIGSPLAQGYLRLIQSGSSTLLQYDLNGVTGGATFATLITFQNLQASSLTAFNFGGLPPDGSQPAAQIIDGSTGMDTLVGAYGDDVIHGLDGIDIVRGGYGNDTLYGDGGVDTVDGEGGDDTVYGGAGDDALSSASGNDILYGEAGADTFSLTSAGTMYADGGDDADWFNIQSVSGHITALGGAGADRFDLISGALLSGGAGQDIYNFSSVFGAFGAGDPVVINDFEAGDGGDRLYLQPYLAAFLQNWSPGANPFGDGHLRLTQSGATVFLQIDRDAGGATFGFVTLATLASSQAGALTAFNTGGYAPGPLLIVGTGAGESLLGGSGADQIDGAGGDDLLTGGAGADTLDGGGGIDTADYSPESGGMGATINLIDGTALDTFGATDTLLSIENATGSNLGDTIYGSIEVNALDGASGNDVIFGGAGSDVLHGRLGNDTLVGNANPFLAEADQLFGDDGDDLIYGENADTIDGGGGLDSLIAVNSYDFTLNMATSSIEYAAMDFGNDTITAATQTVGVSVFASGGNDVVTGSGFNDLIFGGVGNDVITGGNGADAIVGEAGVDQLDGGAGDDRIYFDAQDSFVSGGSGYDAGYVTAGTGVTVNMGASALEFFQDFAGGNDTVLGATMTQGLAAYVSGGNDSVDGSDFADVVFGEAGNDVLSGNGGADVLVGGAGTDVLTGGLGNDALYGGAGDGVLDTFKFTSSGAANADAVYEFEHGIDKLDLSAFGSTFASVGLTDVGGSTVVTLNGQEICTVVGVAAATLTAGDFVFSSPETGGPELAPTAPAFSDETAVPSRDTVLIADDGVFSPWSAPAVHAVAAFSGYCLV